MKDIKLRTKLIIIVLVSVIPMIILNSYMIKFQHEQAIDLELKANQEYAEAIRRVLINYFEKIWHSQHSIGHALVKSQYMDFDKIAYLQKSTSDEPIVSNYLWINQAGQVVSSSNPDQIGVDVSDRDYYRRILNGEDKVVSNLLIDKVNQTTIITISRSIRAEGELKGIVTAVIDANTLGSILPENRLGKTSTFGLVDADGKIVYRSGLSDIPIDKRQIKDYSPAWKALAGEVATFNEYSSSIDSILITGVSVPISKIGWASVASITSEELFEKTQSNALYSFITMLLITLISLSIAIYFIKDLLKPISILQDTANKIGQRNFSVKTNLQRKDELGQTGKAFDKMAEHIKEVEKSRMQFLQTAAHELRNPMASVKGLTSIIYSSIASGKSLNNTSQLMETLNKEVNRLANLLNQILEAFRTERQNVQISNNMQAIDIDKIVTSAVKPYQLDTTHNRNITLNSSESIWVWGDDAKLEDVIRNLLTNAVKFSSEMTNITVSTFIEDDRAVIAVKDQGHGISEDQLTKVFNAFHRSSNVNTIDPGGLGLGLYICKDIIMRHGGKIYAENNKDKGCTFYIKLPLLKDKDLS